jgi:hypothetical protein
VASGGANVGDLQYEIRDEQRQGTDGALYFTPGQGITARGGYPANALEGVALEVGSADEGRKAVTDLVAKKVDFIKIFVNGTPKLSPAVYTAVIDEAKKNNLKIVADAALAMQRWLTQVSTAWCNHRRRCRRRTHRLDEEKIFLACADALAVHLRGPA